MTVAELIKILSECDPSAAVVMKAKLQFEDDDPHLDNLHKVVWVKCGFSEAHLMEWDLSLVSDPKLGQGYATSPTVMLIDHLDG